jgi:hypothetical protein
MVAERRYHLMLRSQIKRLRILLSDRSHEGIQSIQIRPLTQLSTSKAQRQPGLIELARYDPQYLELLLQLDSRLISQNNWRSRSKAFMVG